MKSSRSSNLCVTANAAALEQLFLNLLLNAAQATERAGSIGIEVDRAAGSVTVTIWNTGPGFTTATRQRAFAPFFTAKPEGTGLGRVS